MALQAHNNVSSINGDNVTARSVSHGHDEIGDIPATSDASTVEKVDASWKSSYKSESPPTVERPYVSEEALRDIPGVAFALEHFLSSHMLESEEYCDEMDETKCVINPFQPPECNMSTTESDYISPLGMGSYNVLKA
jgi:hypothetical protein